MAILPRVLYVSANGFLGGAERVVLEACTEHLARKKILPHILFFKPGDAVELAKARGIPHTVLPQTVRLSRPLSVLKAIRFLKTLVAKEKFEIVHSTMGYCQLLVSLSFFRNPLRPKLVWFQHGPVGGWLDTLAKFFKVDAILYNSRHTKEAHHKTHGPNREATERIVPLGVRHFLEGTKTKPHALLEKFDLSEETLVFSNIGRISAWKGQHLFVEAFWKFLAANPHAVGKVAALVVGSAAEADKYYGKALEDAVLKVRPEKHLHLVPSQKDIVPYFALTDVFVHTSVTAEPFGLVIAEAMAQRCLCVVSNLGGATELALQGKNAIVYDARATNAATTLSEIFSQVFEQWEHGQLRSATLQQVCENGHAWVRNQYTTAKMAEVLEAIYTEIL